MHIRIFLIQCRSRQHCGCLASQILRVSFMVFGIVSSVHKKRNKIHCNSLNTFDFAALSIVFCLLVNDFLYGRAAILMYMNCTQQLNEQKKQLQTVNFFWPPCKCTHGRRNKRPSGRCEKHNYCMPSTESGPKVEEPRNTVACEGECVRVCVCERVFI